MVLGAISVWNSINIVLIILIAAYFIYVFYSYIRRRQVSTMLEADEFNAGMRKAQVVDLREKKEFDAGHILGARNIPYNMLKSRMGELRQDMPVYVYDQTHTLSTRAVATLSKNGFKELFILKPGYARWEGKTKKAKY
ncbi:sulfurtransferase [Lactobacillus sp. CBA3606]|uniref:rhodanese-like domain-containing protein n=1 Tax=unclassified Lactobacillus TaxID=2620435 RepID=UPI000CFBEF15|nr:MULTISPECIES: rhodanese-like domain-containing protein [unclassified Lactobacillus]AVK62427.1 sulfurtransferase [Lactobacillus sp. CBA3605]AVK62905.1 sulfurtransferase [Lactobacillus sp. CBA3606]